MAARFLDQGFSEDARVQGSVKTRSCPSTTIDSSRTISIRASLTVTRSMAF